MKIYLFDSLFGYINAYTKYENYVKYILSNIWKIRFPNSNLPSFYFETVKILNQKNGVDCGFWDLFFSTLLSLKLPDFKV